MNKTNVSFARKKTILNHVKTFIIIGFVLLGVVLTFGFNTSLTSFFTSWLRLNQLPFTAQTSSIININPDIRYQTITGWEAESQSGEKECAGFSKYSNSLFDQAVNDLGINRFRLGIGPPCPLHTPCTSTTFDLNQFDITIEKVVIPVRQRLAARGEKLWINVNFGGETGFPNQPDMSAYAQQVLATYQHMQHKYRFIPDSWEIALEPGVVSPRWDGQKIDDAINRTSALLRANRTTFTADSNWTPYFIAPSSPGGPTISINTFNSMLSFNNYHLPSDIKEFSYHRYGVVTKQALTTIAEYRTTYGIDTAMLEHIGSGHDDLHQDLKLGLISAWQQFALAYCTNDNGAQYYWIDNSDPNKPIVAMGNRTKFLRQYFKFIRSGAVRIEATTSNSNFDPVAFINTDGRYAVVVKAGSSGSVAIQGLPAGKYGIKYTTASQYDINAPDVTLSVGQILNTSIPATGVLTVFASASTGNGAVSPSAAYRSRASRSTSADEASRPESFPTPGAGVAGNG